MPEISRLRIYPIKSLRGFDVSTSVVETRGFQHDRRWMLVDEQGLFLTARKDARMLLFSTAIDETLTVTAPIGDTISIDLDEFGPPIKVQVWSAVVKAATVSNQADEWFSDHLGKACRLVRVTPTMVRSTGRTSGQVGFADAMPILVAGESSLTDLCSRSGKTFEMERFRPNLIIKGSAPFAEDEWKTISTAEVCLRATKRCGRCLVTTLDPVTGQGGTEPLATLATFRRFGNNVCFGMYFAPDRIGSMSVGEPITT
jgi:uncharacterized protein YcbX